jgi:hypothetical protein
MQRIDQSRSWDISIGLSEIFVGYLAWALHDIFSTMAMDAGRGHFQPRHITSKSGFILDFLATTSEFWDLSRHNCALSLLSILVSMSWAVTADATVHKSRAGMYTMSRDEPRSVCARTRVNELQQAILHARPTRCIHYRVQIVLPRGRACM